MLLASDIPDVWSLTLALEIFETETAQAIKAEAPRWRRNAGRRAKYLLRKKAARAKALKMFDTPRLAETSNPPLKTSTRSPSEQSAA